MPLPTTAPADLALFGGLFYCGAKSGRLAVIKRLLEIEMMKKLTEKEEIFARAFIELGSQAGAYRKAYNAGKMSDRVIASKAYEVAVKPHVSARIEELREGAKERNQITVDSLLAELEENRQAALCAETPQASAATAATMGKAKLLGLDKQIIDLKSSDGSMTPKGSINIGELSDSAMAEILKARDAADS